MCRSARMGVVGFFFATSGLAGCGDPAVDRLEPGRRVMLVAPPGVDFAGRPHARPMVGYRFVEPGTEARVVADDGKWETPNRRVKVHVLEGEREGLTGETGRDELRPLK